MGKDGKRKSAVRLEAELEVAHARIRDIEGRLAAEKAFRESDIQSLENKLAGEQLGRVAAQNGLIMRLQTPCVSCGEKWWTGEIAYDPENDPEIIKRIEKGQIARRLVDRIVERAMG